MSQYATLKAAITAAIKQNGNNEITGNLLQQQLLAMVNSLGAGYQFAGVATPATNPGTPDQKVWYLAPAGSYPNFRATSAAPFVVPAGSIGVFAWSDKWTRQTIEVASVIPDVIAYAECNDPAGRVAKSVAAEGFQLIPGVQFRVKFVNANVTANPTLNIGGTGARPIVYDGEAASTTNSWDAGEVVLFYYDGTSWIGRADDVEIVDNFSGGKKKALSANMGKILKERFERFDGTSTYRGFWTNYVGITNAGAIVTNNRTAVSEFIPINGPFAIDIDTKSVYQFRVFYYEQIDATTFRKSSEYINGTNYTDDVGFVGYVRVMLHRLDNKIMAMPEMELQISVSGAVPASGIYPIAMRSEALLSGTRQLALANEDNIFGDTSNIAGNLVVGRGITNGSPVVNAKAMSIDRIRVDRPITITVAAGYKYQVWWYYTNSWYNESFSGWVTGEYKLDWRGDVAIAIYRVDNADVTDADIAGCELAIIPRDGILNRLDVLEDAFLVPLKSKIYPYEGTKIDFGLKFGVVLAGAEQQLGRDQGMAIYGEYCFRTDRNGNVAMTYIPTGALIARLKTSGTGHGNNMFFGPDVVEGSDFPPLYVSGWTGNGLLTVWKIVNNGGYSLELMSSITADGITTFVGAGNKDYVIDPSGRYLWMLSYTLNTYEGKEYGRDDNPQVITKFALPDPSANKQFNDGDILESYTTDIYWGVRQGAYYKDGIIYALFGKAGGSRLLAYSILNRKTTAIVPLYLLDGGNTQEAEGLAEYNSRLTFNFNGTSVNLWSLIF